MTEPTKTPYKAPETPEYVKEKFEWKFSDLRPLIVFLPIGFMAFICIVFFTTAMISAFYNGG